MPGAAVEERVNEEETQEVPRLEEVWHGQPVSEGVPAAGPGERLPMCVRLHRPLPLGARIALFVVGWLLVLVGIAGLVLPGIQGVLTIVVGAALLSLDNDMMYRALRRVLRRWPKVWGRVEHFRGKAHDRIYRMFRRSK
jgi:hypothetical protein